MNEIFLLKLGEIVLKGANKKMFENKLRTAGCGPSGTSR